MGFRTVVVLNNDQCGTWSKDPELGQKIEQAMNHATGASPDIHATSLEYGRVVECCHASEHTLAIVGGYSFLPLAHGVERSRAAIEDSTLDLLRDAAAKLGYALVKK